MARRLFLHVGTPKSGTTYLQSVWWANRGELRDQGLLLPGGGVHEHFWASAAVRDNQRLLATLPPAAAGAWDRVLAAADDWPRDVLVSHELFSPAPRVRAARALRSLEGVAEEVHVVLTARDLARQIPAEWQQRTKHGRSQRFSAFVEEVQRDPTSAFWRVQDVPTVVDRWAQGLPADRVHVVVLPPPGGPRSFLWDSLCGLTGVDGQQMSAPPTAANESLGLVEAETMRRVSGVLNTDGIAKSTERLLKDFFAEQVLRASRPEKIVLPPHAYPWVVERADRLRTELAALDVHVVGDLADLVPSPVPAAGRDPDEVPDSEVADAAVRALARFVQHEERGRAQRGRERAAAGARAPGVGRRSPVTRARHAAARGRRLLGRLPGWLPGWAARVTRPPRRLG